MTKIRKYIALQLIVYLLTGQTVFGKSTPLPSPDVPASSLPATQTLSAAIDIQNPEKEIRRDLLQTLTQYQWQIKELHVDLGQLPTHDLQTVENIRNFVGAISSNFWTDDINKAHQIDLLGYVRTHFWDTDTMVRSLLSQGVFSYTNNFDHDARTLSMLNHIAQIATLSGTTKKILFDTTAQFILQARQPKIKFHKKVKTAIIVDVLNIFEKIGPVAPDFHEIIIPFTFSGFNNDINRAAINALKENSTAILPKMVSYYTNQQKEKAKPELAAVFDIIFGFYTMEQRDLAQNIFYQSTKFAHSIDPASLSLYTTTLAGLYDPSCRPEVEKLLALVRPHLPLFSQWTQSAAGNCIGQPADEQKRVLTLLLNDLQAFKKNIGKRSFSLCVKYWGFHYVSAWAQFDYTQYAKIFRIIMQTLKKYDENPGKKTSLLVSLITKINHYSDHTYVLHHSLFTLLLAGNITIDHRFVFSLLDEIVQNPNEMRVLISLLLIALHLKAVDIPDNEFLEERVSKLLHSNIEQNYYFIMKLIEALPLKTNLFEDKEKYIRHIVLEIDEHYYKNKSTFFHYLRLKIHRAISKNSLYLTDAIIDGLASGSQEQLIKNIAPYIKDIAKTSVYQSVYKLDLPAFQHVISLLQETVQQEQQLQGKPQPQKLLYRIPIEKATNILTALPENDQFYGEIIVRLLILHHELSRKYDTSFDFVELDESMRQTLAHLVSPALQKAVTAKNGKVSTIHELQPLLNELKETMSKQKAFVLSPIQAADFTAEKSTYSEMHQALDDFNFLLFGIWTHYKEIKYDSVNDMRFLESLTQTFLSSSQEAAKKNLTQLTHTFNEMKTPHLTPENTSDLTGIICHICNLIDFLEHKGIAQPRLRMLRDILLYEPLTLKQLHNLLGIIAYDSIPHFQTYLNRRFSNLPANLASSLGQCNLDFGYSTLDHKGTFTEEDYAQLVQEKFYGNILGAEPTIRMLHIMATSLQSLTQNSEDHERYVFPLTEFFGPTQLSLTEEARKNTAHRAVSLGSKSFNLHKFKDIAPAFVTFDIPFLDKKENLTNNALRNAAVNAILTIEQQSKKAFPFNFSKLTPEQRTQILAHREKCGIGPDASPLFVSVRSGAFISLPGALETILNVGITQDYIHKMSQDQQTVERFLYHSYYRFLLSFAIAYGNISEDFLLERQATFLHALGKNDITDLTTEEFGNLCALINSLSKKYATYPNNDIPDSEDPLDLVVKSIHAVKNSWDTETAHQYRAWNNVSDAWQTSVTIQEMVHGNLNRRSFTGIVTLEDGRPSGTILYGRGGEALASGHAGHGIALESLRDENPILYKQIIARLNKAYDLERQNVYLELTGEYHPSKQLDERYTVYVLQERVLYRKKEGASEQFVPEPRPEDTPIVRGVGVTGGAQYGVFINGANISLEKLKKKVAKLRAQLDAEEGGKAIGIFLLFDFFGPPEGVKCLNDNVAGIITTKIGTSTHASFVAYREGKILIAEVPGLVRDGKKWFLHGRQIRKNMLFTAIGYPPHLSKCSGCIFEGKIPLRRIKTAAPAESTIMHTQTDDPLSFPDKKYFEAA